MVFAHSSSQSDSAPTDTSVDRANERVYSVNDTDDEERPRQRIKDQKRREKEKIKKVEVSL